MKVYSNSIVFQLFQKKFSCSTATPAARSVNLTWLFDTDPFKMICLHKPAFDRLISVKKYHIPMFGPSTSQIGKHIKIWVQELMGKPLNLWLLPGTRILGADHLNEWPFGYYNNSLIIFIFSISQLIMVIPEAVLILSTCTKMVIFN